MVYLELYELKNLCMGMAELGAANYVKNTAPVKDVLSQREAYMCFGETRVKRWLNSGLVTAQRAGASRNSKRLYSRAELMAASNSEKLNLIINK
ncbi:MAG: hypothetical protein KBS95_06235 [Alistipes sp.]|nr:hypothetical protein [Candidatus Alistipes equi]